MNDILWKLIATQIEIAEIKFWLDFENIHELHPTLAMNGDKQGREE